MLLFVGVGNVNVNARLQNFFITKVFYLKSLMYFCGVKSKIVILSNDKKNNTVEYDK